MSYLCGTATADFSAALISLGKIEHRDSKKTGGYYVKVS